MKKDEGITLITLIITIIILLILSGISVASLIGSGLFEKTKLAKEKQENAQIEENVTLSEYENEISKSINGNRDEQQNSKIQDTVLWTGNILNVGETATLNDSIENYKYLLLETKWGNTSATNNTWLNVNTIKKMGYFETDYSDVNSHAFISMYDNHFTYLSFKSNNSLIISAQYGSFTALTQIIGIK